MQRPKIATNMRLKAMKEAGWKDVPIEIVDWPEDKQREFVIKDNVGYGEWDWELIPMNVNHKHYSDIVRLAAMFGYEVK